MRRWARSKKGQPVDAYYLPALIVDDKHKTRPSHGNLRNVVAALAPHAAPAAQKELVEGLKSALKLRNTFSHRLWRASRCSSHAVSAAASASWASPVWARRAAVITPRD